MFTIPMVGELRVVQGAPRHFELKDKEVILPKAGESKVFGIPTENYADQVKRYLNARIEELKAEALFEFSEKTGADVILSPTYSVITTQSDGLKLVLTVKVKGIPASYADVRPITASDRALVDIDRVLVSSNRKDVRVLSSTESEQNVREEEVRK